MEANQNSPEIDFQTLALLAAARHEEQAPRTAQVCVNKDGAISATVGADIGNFNYILRDGGHHIKIREGARHRYCHLSLTTKKEGRQQSEWCEMINLIYHKFPQPPNGCWVAFTAHGLYISLPYGLDYEVVAVFKTALDPCDPEPK